MLFSDHELGGSCGISHHWLRLVHDRNLTEQHPHGAPYRDPVKWAKVGLAYEHGFHWAPFFGAPTKQAVPLPATGGKNSAALAGERPM